ncbi:hypothetical protein FQN54_000253 [Arachnomyces sp. PD_36]|nr:hypothetical protein FQN54_000253 [Arachnomyces sp. PD_36]
MPPKSSKPAPTDEEIMAQFDDLGVEEADGSNNNNKSKSTSQQRAKKEESQKEGGSEQDLLDELGNLATQRQPSQPATPRMSIDARGGSKRTSTATPPPGRTSSGDKGSAGGKKSDEGLKTGSAAAASAPAETQATAEKSTPQTVEESSQASGGGGGGWWGGIFATASAAVKQAEAAVKEIQNNEEAQKWAEQVKGNVGALKGLGGELRTLALPTFTSIIHTLAPPISSHERLQIHITHDLSGYPALDPIIYAVFSRVMSQVEGGDLLVVQRGQESSPRRDSEPSGPHNDYNYTTSTSSNSPGWHDGPWWRIISRDTPRSISAVPGAVAATKLARASAESYATEYFSSRGGIEGAAKQATEVLSDTNPVRSSDIFLAIQAISQPSSTELFQPGQAAALEKEKAKAEHPEVVDEEEDDGEEIAFALYIHDPIHGIAFHTISQALPKKWIDWLDAPAPEQSSHTQPKPTTSSEHPADEEQEEEEEEEYYTPSLPTPIAEIIEAGGVDPREWVADWIEESITLGVGVIAQRYVARRMGVGEGGVGKGKGVMKGERASVVESGAGEAARGM